MARKRVGLLLQVNPLACRIKVLLCPVLNLLLRAANIEHLAYSTTCFVDDHGLPISRIVDVLPNSIPCICVVVTQLYLEISILHAFVHFII